MEQKITILLKGGRGSGKTMAMERIIEIFRREGWMILSADHQTHKITIINKQGS